MISIEKALLLDRRMRALTSLDGAGFLKLEKRFAHVLAEQSAQQTRAGQPRQRAAGAGPKGALPGPRHVAPDCDGRRSGRYLLAA